MSGTPKQLKYWRIGEKTADEAICFGASLPAGYASRGFAFSPGGARFCVVRESGQPGMALLECMAKDGPALVQSSELFELRLFGDLCELRWERSRRDRGRLSVCTDDEATAAAIEQRLAAQFGSPSPPPAAASLPSLFCRDHVYLLWGEPSGDQHHPGWTRLTSARTGPLWAPLECADGRIVLMAREYFGISAAEFGNAVFISERLTGLRALKAGDAKYAGECVEQIS